MIDSLIDLDTQICQKRFESRLHSIEKSKSLVELIDRAVAMLKKYPHNGERHYFILCKSYSIGNSRKLSEDEILDSLCVSRTTFYREKKKAINILGVILWGFILTDYFN